MYKLSRELFDGQCSHVTVNESLCKTIEMQQVGFVCKNKDHIDFFGGNLLGVQRVRFTDTDRIKWFEDVIQMDEQTLKDFINRLPDIDKTHKVSSDTFNLSCVWMMHKVYIAGSKRAISPALAEKTLVCIGLMLLYRFFTSRLSRHFKYLTDEPTALATYNRLTNKFDIKRLGSWQAVFHDRATNLTGATGLHHKVLEKMDNDKQVVYLLNDTQNRIRAMLKKIYGEFLDVHSQGIKVYSTSANVEYDGEVMFKDKSETLTQYGRYLNEVATDRNAFIKIELINIIADALPTMSPRMLTEVLEWVAANFKLDRTGALDKLIDNILLHAFEVILDDKSLATKHVDITKLVITLRGIYMSSRNTEKILLQNRKETEKLVKKVIKTSNQSAIASVRTGFMLYLVMRAFTMRYYTT